MNVLKSKLKSHMRQVCFVAGDKLLDFDMELIRSRGYLTQTIMVVTDGSLNPDTLAYGQVQVGQDLMQVTA